MKQFHPITASRIALIAFGVIFLTGAAGPVSCTKEEATAVATQALDALCNNLSSADMAARQVLTNRHANGTAFRVEADAVAAVQGICDSRPVQNAGSALVAASAAFARVVAAEQGR